MITLELLLRLTYYYDILSNNNYWNVYTIDISNRMKDKKTINDLKFTTLMF